MSTDLEKVTSAGVSDGVRGIVARAFRALPWLPFHLTLSRKLNRTWLAYGKPPIVEAPMRLGYRMQVDLRTRTQSKAYYSGNYDNEFVLRLRQMLEPGACVFDVGANVGFYTVALAQEAVKQGATLHAFEPLEGNCKRLIANLGLNGVLDAVQVWTLGLSNQAITARLTLREDFEGGADTGNASIVISDVADGEFPQVDIQLQTLDAFCEGHQITRLDLIKADIEGHEDLFLEGGKRTLEAMRPVLFIEVNKQYYQWRGVSLDERLRELLPRGYVTLKSDGGTGRNWRTISSVDACERLDNVFLVPEERLPVTLSRLNNGGTTSVGAR